MSFVYILNFNNCQIWMCWCERNAYSLVMIYAMGTNVLGKDVYATDDCDKIDKDVFAKDVIFGQDYFAKTKMSLGKILGSDSLPQMSLPKTLQLWHRRLCPRCLSQRRLCQRHYVMAKTCLPRPRRFWERH